MDMPAIEIDADGTLLTARELRRRGLRLAFDAQMDRATGAPDAETTDRIALSQLVDAFLLDRVGNQDLFAVAHRIGRDLMREHGCPYTYVADEREYRQDCPIFKLHATVGLSIAWHFACECSICGADAFTCDHAPGEEYEGKTCSYGAGRTLGIDHVALTANPDFIYTWITNTTEKAGDLIHEGVIAKAGDTIRCTHCANCYGLAGPTADDLDPVSRWQNLAAEQGR